MAKKKKHQRAQGLGQSVSGRTADGRLAYTVSSDQVPEEARCSDLFMLPTQQER